MNRDRVLQWLLRLVGALCLLAVVPSVMPWRWMDAIHQSLGMGVMPSAPVVEYLARSRSATCAILGALVWVWSQDVERHRPSIRLLGYAAVALGCFLLAVDWLAGVPLLWTAIEGPSDIGLGLLALVLSARRDGE